ncbi:hypothetical protein V8G54_036555, partial [Vigna mungo]
RAWKEGSNSMNPDVPNIKIKIPGDDESHDQTTSPVAASHASSSDSVDESSNSVDDLYWLAFDDEWDKMRPIVEKDPSIVRTPLTGLGDTALHIAATAGSTAFVKELVKLMRPEDGLIHNENQMLPVHLAALSFHHPIVQLLCSDHLLDKMAYKDIEKLFFITITNNMFDVAITLFEKRPLDLTFARDKEELTSLHMLARKPYEVLKRSDRERNYGEGMKLVERIWDEVRNLTEAKKLKIDDIFELTTKPSVALFDAIESGNGDEVIWSFMEGSGVLMTSKDSNGRNLAHLFFLYRRLEFFEQFLHKRKQYLVRAVDNEGNNVLHLAALLAPEFKSFSDPIRSTQFYHLPFQMQAACVGERPRESARAETSAVAVAAAAAMEGLVKESDGGLDGLLERFFDGWMNLGFKAERAAPPGLRSKKNKKGKTPVDVFFDEHNQLSKDIKESAKGIADSGMVVATLVATVAFAAALTVPGDKKSVNNVWFIVFIVTNAIALFTSSASILSFLSNFTSSRFADAEFVTSLHPSLTVGCGLLIISVAAMVVAFVAASFLIFDHTTKWVSYVVTPMGVFPCLVFIVFQSKFCDDSYWSKYYRPDRKLSSET